ncbi:Trp operon repressor homolog [Chlamydiales bacterium SCGC AG-110-P3]|nr:Trp operon repressor homolog [Chlamydiales bacterium SCGC AG-110-P3]
MSNSGKELAWQRLLQLILKVETSEKLDDLLELFLTISERDALASRYQLVEALLTGDAPQREIAETLGLSISKITYGSNALKRIKEPLRKFLVNAITDTSNDHGSVKE